MTSLFLHLFTFLVGALRFDGFAFCLLFRFIRFVWLVLTRFASRGRPVVGGIKPRTFKDDLGGGDDFSQRFFATFRAGLQRRIIKGLMSLELHTT